MRYKAARAIRAGLLGCALVAAPIVAKAQQSLPAVLTEGARSDVPVAVQIARWHMLDGDINALTFHSMDSLFTTRTVAHSGTPWQLLRADHALDFSYDFGGQSHAAADFAERTYTNALLIMKDGRIVTELYRNNTRPDMRFIGWSMTKSIVSLLVGCAVQEGRIKSLDDPVTAYLPELKDGAYAGVTIRQILQMRSGVDYEERYDFQHPGMAARNHIGALVKNVVRFADVARTVQRAHAPGSTFQYKTIDTAVLGWLLERVSGGSNLAAYMTQRLWEPLGAEADGFFLMDGQPGVGREFSGAGFNATLRDFARLGQMVLDGGKANGRQIVPADWIATATRPTEPEKPGELGYGYQWWTLGDGTFSAIGLQGQFIFVDPKSRTVVVKLSYFPPADDTAPMAETVAFLKAVSAWTPR